ncbi:MAG: aminotransferase class IV [Candidatus Nanopelagicales bacterium]|nr:aminotransferase class IV [Candidatus Nanopelagicales bacterium]
MNTTKVWLNDELVDAQKATVSVFDHGFTVGDGAFETLKVVNTQPVALTRHIKRLVHSLNTIGIEFDKEDLLKKAINEVISANKSLGEIMRMRITYTSGVGPLGSDRTKDNFTLVVAVSPESIWPDTALVITVSDPRNDKSILAGSKTTSYAQNAALLSVAKKQGAHEAIMPNTKGELCEGTGSNIFVVKDGQVMTPPLSGGCLGGITRALVIKWFDVKEVDLPMSVLKEVDESFLTSSTRDIQPISKIDDRVLNAPGPIASKMRKEFIEKLSQNYDA